MSCYHLILGRSDIRAEKVYCEAIHEEIHLKFQFGGIT
jgi:hypothetical protein